MKTTLALLSFSMLILAGCTTPSRFSGPSVDTDDSHTTPIITGEVQEPLTDQLDGNNHEYTLFFTDETPSKSFTIHHEARQVDTVYFINDGFEAMNLSIATDPSQEPANYRLNQIIMPDGSSDGPFGRDLEYILTQNGGYQLIFGESLMQGDERSGNAQVTISLSHQITFPGMNIEPTADE